MVLEVQRPLIIACAALTADLRAVLSTDGLDSLIDVHYLPANLHNAPHKIVGELRPLVEQAVALDRAVFVAYADCGTGGNIATYCQIDEPVKPTTVSTPSLRAAIAVSFISSAARFPSW